MHSSISSSVSRAAVLGVAVTLISAPAVASAQVPGDSGEGVVVTVDSTALVVTVDDKGESPTQVTGSIQNTTPNTFRCATPGPELEGEFPGQVTTASVVRTATEYYRDNIFTGAAGFDVPQIGMVGLGSIQELLPAGSAAGSAEVDSRSEQQTARVAGRTGDPRVGNATVFSVNGGQTVNWTAQLSVPATGDRGEWRAAAMFFCRDTVTNRSYVFSGFEDYPEEETTEPDTGSLGSLSAGSLGS